MDEIETPTVTPTTKAQRALGKEANTPNKVCSIRLKKKTTPAKTGSGEVREAFGKLANPVVVLDTARANITKDGQRCE